MIHSQSALLQYDKFMQTVEDKKNALIDALLILPSHKTIEFENYNAGTNSAPFSSYVYIAKMKKIENTISANLAEVSNPTDFMVVGNIIEKQIKASIKSGEDKKIFTEWWDQQSEEWKTIQYKKMERFSNYVSSPVFTTKPDVRILSINVKNKSNCNNFLQKYNPDTTQISQDEQLQILYGYDFYGALMQAVSGTKDKRKCEAYALLKVMQEHPQHAQDIFIALNRYRSMVWHIIQNMKSIDDELWAQKIADGTMTALMPKTYKQLQPYAENPASIPEEEIQICRLVNSITENPDFSEKDLFDFRQLLQSNGGSCGCITNKLLAKSNVAKALMRQGGFVKDTPDRQAPDEIFIRACPTYLQCDPRWRQFKMPSSNPTNQVWPVISRSASDVLQRETLASYTTLEK